MNITALKPRQALNKAFLKVQEKWFKPWGIEKIPFMRIIEI